MPSSRIGAGGPFLVKAQLSAAIFFVPLNLAITSGFEETETPQAWTRSSVQPPIATPAFGWAVSQVPGSDSVPAWLRSTVVPPPPVPGRAVSALQSGDTTAGWLRSAIPTPSVPGQYLGRTINDPDPLIATPSWTRSSLLPPVVPTNITIGGFDSITHEAWTRSPIQPPVVTPDAGVVLGRAVSEPYVTIPTAHWLRQSILPPVVPVNLSIGGFDEIDTAGWFRSGPIQVPSVGGTSIIDARHRDFLGTPLWLRPTPTATPATPATTPPAGTILIGATWPHEAPFAWLTPSPTIIPGLPPLPVVGLGGSQVVHPKRIIYVKGDRRKPRTFIDKIGEPFIPLERTAEPVPNAASAAPPPVPTNTAPVKDALAARLPTPLPVLPTATAPVKSVTPDDEDDDLLLLS